MKNMYQNHEIYNINVKKYKLWFLLIMIDSSDRYKSKDRLVILNTLFPAYLISFSFEMSPIHLKANLDKVKP